MNPCYVDASVILRQVLNQPGQIERHRLQGALLTSELAWVECGRVLDRLRTQGRMRLDEFHQRVEVLDLMRQAIMTEPMHRAVLRRASGPLDWPLGTLGAIHLATALLWRDEHEEAVDFATHDLNLAQGARLYGCQVLGVAN